MNEPIDSTSPRPEEVADHYASGYEIERLQSGTGRLELERTRELLGRFLPPPPARILDVGGGPGVYALWLARQGYEVHLLDITPLHVRMAQEASTRQPEAPLAGAHVGDARSLPWEDGAADVVLLLGPLYHLTDARDRQRTLAEAYRALKPEGVLLASAISRYASTIDGLRSGYLKDPDFAAMVERDLVDGQHRNPTGDPAFFMDNFFHHPDELRDEIATAGFAIGGIYGIEGLCCLLDDAVFDEWWADETLRRRLLSIARTLEAETPLLGASGHLMAVGRKEA